MSKKNSKLRSGDKLRYGTVAWENRQRRWIHNSYFRQVACARAFAGAIINSQTTTAEAHELARELERLAWKLRNALLTRIDLDENHLPTIKKKFRLRAEIEREELERK